MPRTNPVLDRLPAYPTEQLEARRAQVKAAGRTLVDLGVGDPVEPIPAFLRQALIEGVPEVSGYPSAEGLSAVSAAAAGYLRRRFGVTLDPATQVLPTSGGKEATFQLALLVAGPDAAVGYPDPGYPGYLRGALFAGCEAVPVPLSGDFRMRPWTLPEATLRRLRLLWLNTPHNPSGAVLSPEELRRTWALCREHDVLLVSDECYIDVYDERPPCSLLQVATEGVLALHSLSKRNGLTGFRSGFVAGDPAWVARLAALRTHVAVPPQDFVNAAAVAAWDDDGHAAERRARFVRRKERMRAFLGSIGLQVVASEATFYLWVRVPGGRSGLDFALELLERGVVVAPGEWFGQAGAGYVRLAMCPDDAALEAAIAAWRSAVQGGEG